MIRARVLCLAATLSAALALPAAAGPLDLDGGLRASIFNDNYKLGVGAELGLIQNLGPRFDAGLHLTYSRFRTKIVDWNDANEFGGYATAYYIPTLADQPFEVRIGPHLGGAMIDGDWFVDLGGDAMAIIKLSELIHLYGAFVPSYFLGSESQGMFRVGFGLQYRLGTGSAPAPTGYEKASEPGTGAP